MKKIGIVFISLMVMSSQLLAMEGEMGYFGGASSGIGLPTTVENKQSKPTKVSKHTLPYKEVVYLTGKPVQLDGNIEIRPGKIDLTKGTGKYNENYVMKLTSSDGKDSLTRNITLETQFVYNEAIRQVVKTSKMTKWTEVVSVNGNTYQLDQKKSNFSKSIIEDSTPGVTYYKGDISYDAVYRDINAENSYLTMNVRGPIYGYDSNLSKTETHRRDISITGDNQDYFIEEIPTYTVRKDMEYGKNEPNAISFEGNFKEVISGSGSTTYNIMVGSSDLYTDELNGEFAVNGETKLEQLVAPKIANISNHPAKSDIEKLYSMDLIPIEPNKFNPNKVVTRGEFIEILVKALNIDLPEEKKSSSKDVKPVVFRDLKETDRCYRYAEAAYKSGLIGGGTFNKNEKLTRESMYTLMIRAIGLERMGSLTSGSSFLDDKNISDWAKASMYTASKLDILPVSSGYVFPKIEVNYAEFSALMVKYMDYLRYDLEKDYNEYIIMN